MQYGLLITILGMGAVFAFLCLLTLVLQLVAYILSKIEFSSDLDKIAAVIAIAKRGR